MNTEDKDKIHEKLSGLFDNSVTQAHNTAKRAFNNTVNELMIQIPSVTILDIVLELMDLWDLDPYTVKEMLNTRNKALLYTQLSENWLLVERKIITNKRYVKWSETIAKG